ncbi:alpha/beta hydrolase [Curvibacter sp. HBC61]|uniref:Alpha/beta hydrolase n=1 Tax=Curvibacter cyanobacteriorum TaxID=3026422 RepID=A0ABT5N2D9_9BURK|nr:alpha/beta hydrolase [Curvibacter sp. HBC61]MDD0840466.1 alpha/beta hydrolase [Curvibacter sp. HBC61]
MYVPRRPSRSEFIPIRGHQYHVRVWGEAQAGQPPLVLVHGWMDVAASYQFMVDALPGERHIIAPDWRGFGLTTGPHCDHYQFADYLGDLDALLDHCTADQPIDLVGHSMGGNVVMMYAGARPQRIRRLVNLEGFGMPASRPSQAPGRYAKWMDELKALRRGEMDLKSYDSLEGVAQRLIKTNPRLSANKARWLAPHWAQERPQADGSPRWHILGEAAHKVTSAQLYRADEALELYQRISAPLLAVEASDDSLGQWWKGQYTLADYHERLKRVPQHRIACIDQAGHMLHHDQPEALARLLTEFLT